MTKEHPRYLDNFSIKFKKIFLEVLTHHTLGKKVLGHQQSSMPDGAEHQYIEDLHNHYLDFIINTYLSKVTMCCEMIIHSVKNKNYLCYALACRSLLELVAVLDYYVDSYLENLNKNHKDLDLLYDTYIDLHELHIKGTRFDWVSLVNNKIEHLEKNYIEYIKNKKKKSKGKIKDGILSVNATTCVEKIGEKEPRFGVLYNLFCDLVHPNIGNTFLTVSGNDNSFGINSSGVDAGMVIIEETLGDIVKHTLHRLGGLNSDLLGMYTDGKKRNSFNIEHKSS